MGQGIAQGQGGERVREVLHLGQGDARGLFRKDVEAGAQGRLGDGHMEVVGRDDHQQLDPLLGGQSGFAGQQGLPGGMDPLRRQTQLATGRLVVGRITAEGAAGQFERAIQGRGAPMGRADEGPLAATDHAIADLAAGFSLHPLTLGL